MLLQGSLSQDVEGIGPFSSFQCLGQSPLNRLHFRLAYVHSGPIVVFHVSEQVLIFVGLSQQPLQMSIDLEKHSLSRDKILPWDTLLFFPVCNAVSRGQIAQGKCQGRETLKGNWEKYMKQGKLRGRIMTYISSYNSICKDIMGSRVQGLILDFQEQGQGFQGFLIFWQGDQVEMIYEVVKRSGEKMG